jgi:ParB family chromosome partitioning protein
MLKGQSSRDAMSKLIEEFTGANKQENLGTTQTLDIIDLVPFTNHPFKLYEGARLDDMVRSVKELGVVVPIVVRPIEGEYTHEILSGHNRVNAAKLAGLTEVPAVIKTGLSDEDAALIVTETNLIQRSFADLTHSQRAVALKRHMDAISKQGKRTDLIDEIKRLSNPDEIRENGTSCLVGAKLNRADEQVGEQYGLSSRTVARYVRVALLSEPLQQRIDSEEIGLYPAVSLSYLTPNEQTELERQLSEASYKLDMKKAESLRELSEGGKLTPEKMAQVLSGELNKKPKPKTAPAFKLKAKIYQKYFPGDTPQKEIETTIDQALAAYFEQKKEATV